MGFVAKNWWISMGIRHDNLTYEYILELHSFWKKSSVSHKLWQDRGIRMR